MLDDAFYGELESWAAKWGVPPSWPLLALYLESRLDPTEHRAGSRYWGLSQLNTKDVQRLSGVDGPTYLTWPASQQMHVIGQWYTETLGGKTPKSPGVFFAYNLAPARVGDGNANNVLYASPSTEYSANAGLDVNKDGNITIGDLDAFMAGLAKQSAYKAALAKLNNTASPYTSQANVSALLVTMTALGVAAYHDGVFSRRRYNNPIIDRKLLIVGGVALAAGGIAVLLRGSNTPTIPAGAGPKVFPILDVPGVHFTNDWHAQRSGHLHQGDDIFAPMNTPIVAPDNGKLTFTNDGIGGGLSFHLTSDGGLFYFGTHLTSFVGGNLGDSRNVVAGEEIGTVGISGNAVGTPPHLHFEIHVNGVATNPYPYLVKLPRLTMPVA